MAAERRWSADVAAGALTMAGVLVAFGAAYGLSRVADLPRPDLVLAPVLALTLTRTFGRGHSHPWFPLVEVPLLGVGATAAGWLLMRQPWIGQPLLALALCLGVQARRWTGLVHQAGRLIALPFLALLVTPVAPDRAGDRAVPATVGPRLGAAVGLIAVLSATETQRIRVRLLPSTTTAGSAPARRRPGRLDAVTRSALQLAVALAVALGLGHLLFGERWTWALLSAYLVMSGARGRGDVVHKAGLRVLGATLGTVIATGVTVPGLPTGNRWLIVGVFAVMAVGVVLRNRSYAWWAASVTAMIALLDGYYGQPAARALPDRVLGVLVGSAIGVAVAWWILPLRTADVLRRYLADCLGALTDDLGPDPEGPPRAPAALHTLRLLRPTLVAHRSTLGRGLDPHPVQAIDAVGRLAELPADPFDRRRLGHDVIRVRRAIVGKDDFAPDELPVDLATVHLVIRATLARPAGSSGRPAAARAGTGLRR